MGGLWGSASPAPTNLSKAGGEMDHNLAAEEDTYQADCLSTRPLVIASRTQVHEMTVRLVRVSGDRFCEGCVAVGTSQLRLRVMIAMYWPRRKEAVRSCSVEERKGLAGSSMNGRLWGSLHARD